MSLHFSYPLPSSLLLHLHTSPPPSSRPEPVIFERPCIKKSPIFLVRNLSASFTQFKGQAACCSKYGIPKLQVSPNDTLLHRLSTDNHHIATQCINTPCQRRKKRGWMALSWAICTYPSAQFASSSAPRPHTLISPSPSRWTPTIAGRHEIRNTSASISMTSRHPSRVSNQTSGVEAIGCPHGEAHMQDKVDGHLRHTLVSGSLHVTTTDNPEDQMPGCSFASQDP